MSAVVKLSSALPGGPNINGLDSLHDELIADPLQIRVACIWYDSPKASRNNLEHTETPVVRVRRVEPLGNVEDVPPALRDLIQDAIEKRTGDSPLPFDNPDFEVEE